jgi:CRISPR/Cas system-associated endonuclease Cas3-HD
MLAYQSVFAAAANGRHFIASQVLRSMTPEDVIELAVICQDMGIVVEADQRRRVGEKRKHEGW